MGPTNAALVKFFQADQKLRAAQDRYDSAARNVRLFERKVADLTSRYTTLQQSLRQQQSAASQLDLDLQTRDAHIEKLRLQQSQTSTNKEYQAFLTEINTEKVDRNKIEEQAISALEAVERTQAEAKTLQGQLDEEQKKLDETRSQLSGKLAELQSQIDELRPARDAAYDAVPPKARVVFERLAERHEGEAMSPMEKPDRRNEEYVCGACQMALVVDVYNRLHSRDDLVTCSNCGRVLYIPEDLTPEVAVHKAKEPKAPRVKKEKAYKGGPSVGAAVNRQSSAEDVVNSVTIEDDSPEGKDSAEPTPPADQ